jgi:hypothetical protein
MARLSSVLVNVSYDLEEMSILLVLDERVFRCQFYPVG